MKIGDEVQWIFINQRTGLREFAAPVRLLNKVGTVPNFWQFVVLAGTRTGQVLRDMIYEEDQDHLKPKLEVIQGGKSEDRIDKP